MQQQQLPPKQSSGLKVFGLFLIVVGALLCMLGLCSIWALGLGLVPLIIGAPMFLAGLLIVALN
jgi:hypothetical protein